MDNPIVVSARHLDAPWIAANLAVLNEAAGDVRLDVDFRVLAAKRTRDRNSSDIIGNPTAMLVSPRATSQDLSEAVACASAEGVLQPTIAGAS